MFIMAMEKQGYAQNLESCRAPIQSTEITGEERWRTEETTARNKEIGVQHLQNKNKWKVNNALSSIYDRVI